MRLIVKKNNEFISTHNSSTKIVDRNIRIERIVPQIIEKIVEVERVVEVTNEKAKIELTEKEKEALKKVIREEFKLKLKEMESNIRAYQELLLVKQTELKAYATELAAL